MAYWHVDKHVDHLNEHEAIEEAAALLQQNEIVAFPTETVYGLGGNACSDEAVSKIFNAKGRPADNPLIVHIYSFAQLDDVAASVPSAAQQLMKAFWPGPLTIILPAGNKISKKATAGLDTVGVRMPNHPVALALIEKANLPIAAPSANRSGKPSPTAASHVIADLEHHIAGVIDGGKTGLGVESTVVQAIEDDVVILRPGGITREQLESAVGKERVKTSRSDGEAPRSPGMKYAHYAPRAPLYLVYGDVKRVRNELLSEQAKGRRVGILTTSEHINAYADAECVIACGKRSDLPSVAKQLYAVLRQFDAQGVDVIISESFPKEGIGEAIMNRLEKAAAKTIG